MLGDYLQIGSIGGAIDTVLKPIYEDTVLAWMETKLHFKSQIQGWSRYFEFFQDGSGKAYTLNSVMVLRAGAWQTRPYSTFGFDVMDARPFVVGKHYWIGDRVGATRRHDYSKRIYIDRVSKLTRTASRTEWQKWSIAIGGDGKLDDPGAMQAARIEGLAAAVHDLGVY